MDGLCFPPHDIDKPGDLHPVTQRATIRMRVKQVQCSGNPVLQYNTVILGELSRAGVEEK